MIYVTGDIHGCYAQYRRLLEQIGLGDSDTLYVLGDVVDRGPEPVRVLRDMALRANVIPLLGNHDYLAMSLLSRLSAEITEENYRTQLDETFFGGFHDWIEDGGQTTLEEFARLPRAEQNDVLDYLGEFSLYEEVRAGGRDYLLVHAGLEDFSPEKSLDDYRPDELLLTRTDYSRVYFNDKILVTGHTPTFLIDEACRGKIYTGNRHLAVDCGAVYGETLGAVCLDTGREYYAR